MRRIFVLLIPALLLVVMVAASRWTANLHYVASGRPGDLLYVAAFDGSADNWHQYDDGRLSASVTDGALRLTNNAPGGGEAGPNGYSLAEPSFGDFDLRVRATAVEGPVNNAFGVVFRFQDQQRTTEATWRGLIVRQFENLFLGLEPARAYYLFLVSSDGYYQVRRAHNAGDTRLSDWIRSDVVHQGLNVSNELRVIAVGGRFQFSVNDIALALCIPDDPDATSTINSATGECVEGQMLPTLTDNAVSAGQIGVVTQAFDDPGVVVDFDNVIVTAPQPIS